MTETRTSPASPARRTREIAVHDPHPPVGATRELAEKYRRLAPRYDLQRLVFDWLGVGEVRRRLASRAQGRILEVAVGTGGNLPHYPRGGEITGVDLSPEMLTRARQRSLRTGRGAAFGCMATEELAFPDASFDTVVDSLALCTYPDPIAALKEMRRVCKPDGRILLLEHGRSERRRLSHWQQRRDARKGSEPGCHWSRDPAGLALRAGLRPDFVQRRLFGVFQLIEARLSDDSGSQRTRRGHEYALHLERSSLR